MNFMFAASDGYHFEQEVIVRVPQSHGFELREPMLEVYGIRPGEVLAIPILFTNSGNGDERFEFEFDDAQVPMYWNRTGATSHTLGAFIDTTHTVSVQAPANATGDEEFTVTVTVRDKANNSYPAIPIRLKTSLPVLEIVNVITGTEPTYGSKHMFTVLVENTGLVDATGVTLNGTVRGTNVTTSVTNDVLAGHDVTFYVEIDLTEFGAGDQWFDFEISSDGQEFGEEPETASKRFTLRAPSVESNTPTTVIGVLLAGLLIIVAWYFTRSGPRRPGAPF